MRTTFGRAAGRLAGPLLLLLAASRVAADEPGVPNPEAGPREALVVRLNHPDRELARLIAFFQGERVPHPAAALSAWKRANGEANGLGKGLEALIAVMNPEMAREARLLHGAEVRVSTEGGQVRWSAVVPRDDGSLSAFVTALVLTDGATLAPAGELPVYRLGPEGAPLAATDAGRLTLGSNRERLESALGRPKAQTPNDTEPDCILFELDSVQLNDSRRLTARRLGEFLRGTGYAGALGSFGLGDHGPVLAVRSTPGKPDPKGASPRRAVDPAWLDAVIGPGAFAAGAFALETDNRSLGAAFSLLDRVEKADPARSEVAPARTRLNLAALTARVNLEVDLWPDLVGASGAAWLGEDDQVSDVVLALHAEDVKSARRIAQKVVLRLASFYLKAEPVDLAAEGRHASLGRLGGRPLAAAVRGSTVLVAWGDRGLKPGAATEARTVWAKVEPSPQRLVLLWPARSNRLVTPGTALHKAVEEAPPVVWVGRNVGDGRHDEVRWSGLKGVLHRWLETLTLKPPADRGPVR